MKHWLIVGLLCATALNVRADLRDQVADFCAQHGIQVEGLGKLAGFTESAPPESGTTRRRLEVLLSRFNHFILLDDGGATEKVVILSAKTERPPELEYAISTKRAGAHHIVSTTMTGPNGVGKTVPMMVDTGATMLILPNSLIPTLGFKATALEPGIANTANGEVPALFGVLSSVRLGQAFQRQVNVAFVDDSRLNGNMLLGMSFLGRFRFTLEDKANRLLLRNN